MKFELLKNGSERSRCKCYLLTPQQDGLVEAWRTSPQPVHGLGTFKSWQSARAACIDDDRRLFGPCEPVAPRNDAGATQVAP